MLLTGVCEAVSYFLTVRLLHLLNMFLLWGENGNRHFETFFSGGYSCNFGCLLKPACLLFAQSFAAFCSRLGHDEISIKLNGQLLSVAERSVENTLSCGGGFMLPLCLKAWIWQVSFVPGTWAVAQLGLQPPEIKTASSGSPDWFWKQPS